MDNKKIKNINRILSIFILISSPIFIYFTSIILLEDADPMGFRYLIISLFKNNKTSKFYFIINNIGSIYTFLLLVLLI